MIIHIAFIWENRETRFCKEIHIKKTTLQLYTKIDTLGLKYKSNDWEEYFQQN